MYAQYKTGIGGRIGLGSSYGLNFKNFFTDRISLEAMAFTRWEGYCFAGLIEMNQSFNKSTLHTTNLGWFIGAGAHLGNYPGNSYKMDANNFYNHSGDNIMAIGVDAILGIEYEFYHAPISLSLDVKPNYSFINPTPDILDVDFTIRYVWGRR